jgi:hypothetical protein
LAQGGFHEEARGKRKVRPLKNRGFVPKWEVRNHFCTETGQDKTGNNAALFLTC